MRIEIRIFAASAYQVDGNGIKSALFWVPTAFSKNKKHKQIESVENGYVVKDDIELSFLNTIPLWAFGLNYWVNEKN